MLKSVSNILDKIRVRKLRKTKLFGRITAIEKSSVEKPKNIANAGPMPHMLYVKPRNDGTCPVCNQIHSL